MTNELIWQVRYAVYQYFADQRKAPTLQELAVKFGVPKEQIQAALKQLNDVHHALKIDPETYQILMAWPFSATPTIYVVDTPKGRYWANCAWDALAIPDMVGQDSHTTYNCPDCEEEIEITIKDGRLEATEAVVHFTIQPKVFYDNLGCI